MTDSPQNEELITRLKRANEEKAKRAAELIIANEELAFQNEEKAKRVAELMIANEEKAKRAAELVIANEELAFQNEEKAKRVAELIIANKEKAKRAAELVIANEELAFQNEEKLKRVAELNALNEEKIKHVAELVLLKLKAAHNEKIQLSLMETIDIARQLVEMRDPYTAGHEKHVGDLAKAIAAELGFDSSFQEAVLIAGYLHDIGKIIIPVEILCKPGKISDEEYNLIKNHVQASYDLVKNVSFPWPISRAILEHHERIDGSGYPNKLEKSQISMEGRILAVADVVEAMSFNRPYRIVLGKDAALAEINNGREKIYDGAVVDACVRVFQDNHFEFPVA
jgi:putative nucleotidyltransferase with HDIG domain